MANICDNSLTISVIDEDHDGQLDELYKRIDEQDKDILKIICWFEKSPDYGIYSAEQDDEGVIHVGFSSKWAPPEKELKALSKLYPHLSFEISACEPGNGVYLEQTYQDGVMSTETELTAVEYYTKNNPDFEAERKDIERLPSSEAVEYILQAEESEDALDPHFDDLYEEIALSTVKEHDLPLLINHEWRSGASEETYKKRMSSIQRPK
jgi:hypothetical protein